jgi:hypothetical protein
MLPLLCYPSDVSDKTVSDRKRQHQTMTQTISFRTPAAVFALLALVAVIASPVAAANTFRESDADAFRQLGKNALTLHRDINDSMSVLGQSREREFDHSCLSELENVLDSVQGNLSSVYDLVMLSAKMRDSEDEITVNTVLAFNVSFAIKILAENRRYAIAQGALCPTSALVNIYAQKTAAITDRADVLFDSLNDRVGWLVHRQP